MARVRSPGELIQIIVEKASNAVRTDLCHGGEFDSILIKCHHRIRERGIENEMGIAAEKPDGEG